MQLPLGASGHAARALTLPLFLPSHPVQYQVDVLGKDQDYDVTASFFGDGTCNVGQFYECLNMASLYKLPHIFVVSADGEGGFLAALQWGTVPQMPRQGRAAQHPHKGVVQPRTSVFTREDWPQGCMLAALSTDQLEKPQACTFVP